MRSPRPAPLLLGTAALACLGVAACVFGFRGEVELVGEASLAGLETVQLHLPATELSIRGEPARSTIRWAGSFITLGGSSEDALRGARSADLVWDSWASIGRLWADLPVEIRDLTSLDDLEVESSAALAHEIIGAGKVSITGIDGFVSVDLEGGDVTITGGLEQLRVRTERGSVDLHTAAAVDLYSGIGSVHVASEANGEILIDASGSVLVELAQFGNLDLDIADAGQILVLLDDVAHVGAGSYRRAIGPATRELRIRAGGGPVEVRELE
ncbi:MAG: hypothetical protein R6X02_03015 [Enhygromyxa sp.]